MGNVRDNKDEYSIDLVQIVKSLWRRAWIIVMSGLLTAMIGFSIAAFAITPQYSSSVMLYVTNSAFSTEGNFSITSSEISAARSLVQTCIVMLQNRTTLESVIDAADVSYSYEQLENMIEASSVNGTEVMLVTVTTDDPYEAAKIANAIAEVLPRRISEIIENSSMEVVDSAAVNLKKVAPSSITFTVVGLIIGVVGSVWVLVLLVLWDDTIRDDEYILQNYDYPILARIPDLMNSGAKRYGYYFQRSKSTKRSNAVEKTLHKNLEFSAIEQYKLLRANLRFTLPEGLKCPVIGVTSSMGGEGVSTTAVNLSYVLAESGKRVLLIDGNLRVPSVAQKMEISNSSGLTNLLMSYEPQQLENYKSPLLDNWYILPAGDLPPNPSELLGSHKMEVLLNALAEQFDFIVIDLPPVNLVSDALVISNLISGMIVVIREDYTEKNELDNCFRQLKLSNANVLGCVMNHSKNGKGSYGKYRYTTDSEE